VPTNSRLHEEVIAMKFLWHELSVYATKVKEAFIEIIKKSSQVISFVVCLFLSQPILHDGRQRDPLRNVAYSIHAARG
jgi:hypothetical protein